MNFSSSSLLQFFPSTGPTLCRQSIVTPVTQIMAAFMGDLKRWYYFQLRESTLQCCSPFHIGHDNLSTLSANQYYTSIFYQGCNVIDSKAWPPWQWLQWRWQGDGRMSLTICGCAIINLSSPENYFFPSKVALPKVRSLFHCQSHL